MSVIITGLSLPCKVVGAIVPDQASLPGLPPPACKRRSYRDEATAKRCLWAMTVRGFDTTRMAVERCGCGKWHVGKAR